MTGILHADKTTDQLMILGAIVSIVYSFDGVLSVLVIGGVKQEEPPSDSRSLFTAHPIYRDTAKQFLSIGSRVVGSVGLLYIKQREMAVTHPSDKNVDVMGSDYVTSSIIAILRHTGSGAVGLAHFDGFGTEEAVINMVQSVQDLTQGYEQKGRYELSLIGGVTDENGHSKETFSSFMRAFHKQAIEIHLRLACIGELNTIVKNDINWPILYGAGVNVKTGDIFPATFPDKGPEQALRSTRYFTGDEQVMAIYDCQLGLLTIGPFDYKPLDGVDLWLKESDDDILLRMSSTPKVEPPDFVAHTKATFIYIRDNPFPSITVFPDGRSHCYRRDERGIWSPMFFCSTLVLVIGGVSQEEPPSDSRSLFTTHPIYRDTAKQFLSIGSRVESPVGLLYIKQREMAVTHPPDENVDVMGSDYVTSSIIAILRHTGSGAVGLAHFDGFGTEEAVINMVQSVQDLTQGYELEGRYELSLIGGVTDENGFSEETFSSLMRAFHKQAIEIHLRLACIGELNTIVKNDINWPILYGAGVNVKTGDIFPATFPDKGPEQALRSTRYFTGDEQVMAIYDCQLGLLTIGPFDYKPLDGIDLLLKQTDDDILLRMSSTPKVEPPDFVAHTKATFIYIRDNPFPATTVFPDGRPHCYRRDERGLWSPLSPAKPDTFWKKFVTSLRLRTAAFLYTTRKLFNKV